ncbi:MAG: UDP-N-acetylmuramate--L-alanine ligase [Bacteroidales bacterium]|jgi:UDP-N-acetylmuramate--alanine ligase|nr:UDP-N-acetylmuramate--L-alanine ligase [Bacteroidales bacterium]
MDVTIEINSVYMLGIGGIGMSALARYFHRRGVAVSGYDKTPSTLTDELIAEGIDIHFEEDISKIPGALSMTVYTPAVPKDNQEYQFLKKANVPFLKRSEVLELLTHEKTTYAVAGTHGKTSTTALAAHLLHQDKKITAFIGGIALNFNSNLVDDEQADIMLVEADEYDRSFLALFPDMAVITAMDADHLDIYGDKRSLIFSFNCFADHIKDGGTLITKRTLLENIQTKTNTITYGIEDEDSDYYARNIRIADGKQYFDIITPQGSIDNIPFEVGGLHNIENAVAAVAMADLAGVKHATIKEQLASYKGVKRRFEYIIRREDCIYIDDYAHHPQEIRACIASIRRIHPHKKICGIFQPHLYSRTRDFADEFARSLEELDHIILLDIYPARELPIKGVTSKMLLEKINNTEKVLLNEEQLLQYLEIIKPELLVTMGAGSIDRLVNVIKKTLNHE